MEYLPKFSACRDIGHQWDYFEWFAGRRVLVCQNCGTKREDTLDAYAITKSYYRYPKGYSWKGESMTTRELRQQLRREAAKLARWVGKKPEQQQNRRRA